MMKFELSKEVVQEVEVQVRQEIESMSAFSGLDLSTVTKRQMTIAIADVLGDYVVSLLENMPRELVADIGSRLSNKEHGNV